MGNNDNFDDHQKLFSSPRKLFFITIKINFDGHQKMIISCVFSSFLLLIFE